ncbi:unnamed protein product [Closterium sp. Yama58-4]|nr:unnamed protein product [Closterium sp. Yama58-4]
MANGNPKLLVAALRTCHAGLLRTFQSSSISAAPLPSALHHRCLSSLPALDAVKPGASAPGKTGAPLVFTVTSSSRALKDATCQLEVWSWGRGDSGQLGHGEENPEWTPRRIESLSLEISALAAPAAAAVAAAADALRFPTRGQAATGAVRSASLSSLKEQLRAGVSCGISHSLLWLRGRLWVWGRGDGGRLGLGNEISLFSPTLNPNFLGETAVRSAAAGGLHSLAVSERGELFTWGYGGFGALGHGEFTRRDVPCHVAPSDWLEEGVEIKSAAAGGSHTFGLSTAGRVYAWGRDEGEGRLGIPHIVDAIGEEGCVPRPIPVEFPASQGLPRGGVSLVACGGFFSAAVDCEGGVWTWGGEER